jgi:MoaA/NifB/PqqE/SkfB family radical SAM enzyme
MEPDRQLEIQLGHLCNNRCVFCVSGQRTALREAFPVPAEPVVEKLREGRAQGLRKVTLLGGEPTLQPEFLAVVRAAVHLGYEDIVVFTNGAKTARGAFIDEVLATGGSFTWRLSFQGATALAHERTTRKLGSFQRLVETLRNLRARDQRSTVNMCLVRSNAESVAAFPALLLPYGVRQLHLDMVRPLDAGVRTEDELRAMIPRYADLLGPLTAMVQGFEREAPGFDVNIGNLPYCVAPALAPWIHHDGEATLTVAVDQRDALSEAWDKYLVKRRDKVKPATCAACVFDDRCSGVFETYAGFYGLDELVPITPERLRALDPSQRLFELHARAWLRALETWEPPAPFVPGPVRVDALGGEVLLRYRWREGAPAVELALRRGGDGSGGLAASARVSLHGVALQAPEELTLALLRGIFEVLQRADPGEVLHPVAGDAVTGALDPRLGRCLRRLRQRAPFGALVWKELVLAAGGREARVEFATREGAPVTVSLMVKNSMISGGYRLGPGLSGATPGLSDGVRAIFATLSAG